MIKAMVFDLDGTLLDQDKKIPDSAKNVLRLCRKKRSQDFPCNGQASASSENACVHGRRDGPV